MDNLFTMEHARLIGQLLFEKEKRLLLMQMFITGSCAIAYMQLKLLKMRFVIKFVKRQDGALLLTSKHPMFNLTCTFKIIWQLLLLIPQELRYIKGAIV